MSLIDYGTIPEFAKAIAFIQKAQADGESVAAMFLYESGKKLELTVEVTDPEIARVVLGSSFGPSGLMPGMKITNVRFGDLERKDVLKAWLRSQLETLDHPCP